MVGCSLETLGAFALRIDGRTAPNPSTQKARALLVYLIMHRGKDVARERLMELLWPDAEPERARESLRTALHSIRRSIKQTGCDPDVLLAASKSIVRWTPQTTLDVDTFTELAQREDQATVFEALALYRGDFLEGDYENWTVIERERLASRYEALLARALKATDDPEIARRLVERNPYEEQPYIALIDAELAAGRRTVAQRLVMQCRAALAELGARPSEDFESRYADLARPTVSAPKTLVLPFVGRERELSALERSLDGAMAARGSLTVVSGEPGIGKSTLLAHLGDAAQRRGVRVLHVQCLAGDPRPFGPWQAVFEGATGLSLQTFVESAGRDVASDLAQTLVAALTRPGLIIVDDLQYARGAAHEVAMHVLRFGSREYGVVAAARPEGLPAVRSALGELHHIEMPLEPLTPHDLAQGLQALSVADDDPLISALHDRTDGNPFYIASFLDELVKSGALLQRGYRWEIDRDRALDLTPPRSLKRSIDARLRSRGETAANVACALALDADAEIDDVGDALDLDDTERLDALDDLLALGVVVERSSGARLSFVHDVVREVAAQLLNAARRARIHRALADRLARFPTRNAALRRARHLEAAGELIAAATSYRDAAVEAMELRAITDAAERCAAGLRALEKVDASPAIDAMRSGLYLVQTENFVRNGRYRDGVGPSIEAVRLARSSGDERALLRALQLRSGVYLEVPAVDELLRDAEELGVIAERLDDRQAAINAIVKRSWGLVMLEEGDRAIAEGERALALAQRVGSDRDQMVAADNLIRAASLWWHFRTAAAATAVTLTTGPRIGWNAEVANLSAAARLWLLVGRLELACSMLEQARADTRSRLRASDVLLSMPMHELRIDYILAVVLAELGRLDEAFVIAERSMRHPLVQSEPDIANTIRLNLVDVVWRRDGPADRTRLGQLYGEITDARVTSGIVYGGLTPEILRGVIAVRLGLPQAPALLAAAVDHSEAAAARKPFDCLRGFAKLVKAAAEAGLNPLHARCSQLLDEYGRRHAVAVAGLEQPVTAGSDDAPHRTHVRRD